jgi:hypothetical protein
MNSGAHTPTLFRFFLQTDCFCTLQTADVERQLQEAADAEAFQFKVSFAF